MVVDKNPKDKNGWTPLHDAARFGFSAIFDMIFEIVDDKNPEDNFGRTPLNLAEERGHEDICRKIYAGLWAEL